MASNSQTHLHNALLILKTKDTNGVFIFLYIIQSMNLYFGPYDKILYQSSSVSFWWHYSRFGKSKIFEHDISYSEEEIIRPDMSQTSSILIREMMTQYMPMSREELMNLIVQIQERNFL